MKTLNNNMKLPQMKHIMEINEEMKPVLNMIKNGDYLGDKSQMMLEIDELQIKYENDYVFQDSCIFSNLDSLTQGMQKCAQNGIVSNMDEDMYSQMTEVGNDITQEYKSIIEKYNI